MKTKIAIIVSFMFSLPGICQLTSRDMTNMQWTNLTDLVPSGKQVGHDKLIIGKLVMDEAPLKVESNAVRDGIYAHASSRLTYDISGKGFTVFRGEGRIQDGYSFARLQFTVLGDGKELWKSDILRKQGDRKYADASRFAIDMSNISKLELFVDDLGNNGDDHSIWLQPQLGKKK